jgi:hypothetical protein
MCRTKGVRVPLRKSNFYGEREPDNHGAPLEQSLGPPGEPAAPGSWRDRNYAQLAENLGRDGVASRSGAAAIGAAKSLISLRLWSSCGRVPLTRQNCVLYRGTRPSCIGGMEAVEPREQVGRLSKYESALFIRPSVVNLGGTAVV